MINRKTIKVVFINILVFLISINMSIIAFATETDEENYELDINTWILSEEALNEGMFFYLDETGMPLANQVTPDGYYVNEDGALVVENQVVRVHMNWDFTNIPFSEDELKSGEPYVGRWIGTCGYFEKDMTPFEIAIYRSGKEMYVEFYELKYGKRIGLDKYSFIPGDIGKYVIEMNGGYEEFQLIGENDMQSEYIVEQANGEGIKEESKVIFYYIRVME